MSGRRRTAPPFCMLMSLKKQVSGAHKRGENPQVSNVYNWQDYVKLLLSIAQCHKIGILRVVQQLALPGNFEIKEKKICRKNKFSCVCSLMYHGRVMNVVGKMYLCKIWYHSCAMPDSPYIDKLDILVR
jgi:hypothetical protein